MMSLFALFAKVLAVFAVGTGAKAGSPGSDAAPFPGYQAECGYPIVYSMTLALSEAVIDGRGRLKIVIDPSLTARVESDRLAFLLAHECAHHQMEHARLASRRARAVSDGVIRDQELSADCWAAEMLARLGHERPILLMTQRFYRAGLYSPGGGYPAGVQRASIIQQCARHGRQTRLLLRSTQEAHRR